MDKKEKRRIKFFGIRGFVFFIVYIVIFILSCTVCALSESDGDTALWLFLVFFGILFLIAIGVALVVSGVTALVAFKGFKAQKRTVANIVFSVFSLSYFVSLILALYYFFTFDMSF